MLPTTVSVSLLERTQYLVKHRPRTITYAHIAAATGVKASWVEAFSRGKIADPGVKRVEAIFSYLVATKA